MPRISPLARATALLPRVQGPVPPEAFGHPALQSAVEAVYKAQRESTLSPRDPNLAKNLQRSYLLLVQTWQRYASALAAGQSGGASLEGDFSPPRGGTPLPQSLLSILNSVPVQYDPVSQQPFVIPAGAPGSPEAQVQADYSPISDAIYNEALLLGGVKAVAATQTPLATKTGVAPKTPLALYQNTSTIPMVVFVRADSPNAQVSALFLAGALAQAVQGSAPLAEFSSPLEITALVPANATLYGSVWITGADQATIIVSGIALQGGAALGLGGGL